MTADDFSEASAYARKIDKKAIKYKPYKGKMNIEKSIEFNPEEYADFSYADLVNFYGKVSKIISTASSMEKYAVSKPAKEKPKPEEEKKRKEVVTKLQEMTKKNLEEARKMEKKKITAPGEAPEKEIFGGEIEFEFKKTERKKKAPEKPAEIEMPEPEIPEPEKIPEPATEKREEKPEEKKEEAIPPALKKKAPEKPTEMKKPPLPPVLRESPDEAAEKKYVQIEEELSKSLGKKIDEKTIKKKMLELTKELFKTKSINRRQRIKLEISVLKNMITRKKKKGAKGKLSEKEAHKQLLETIVNTQKSEIASNKDKIVENYKERIKQLKDNFYMEIEKTEKPAERKKIYQKFVVSLTELVEELPGILKEHEEFSTKKHISEIEKLKSSLSGKENKIQDKANERIEEIDSEYHGEYQKIKRILAKDVDSLIELVGKRILKKKGETVPEQELKEDEIIDEVNSTDEGTLLYYLHLKNPDYYKKYERKHVSKAEALTKAKVFMAQEKGLGEEMVRRHFGELEV